MVTSLLFSLRVMLLSALLTILVAVLFQILDKWQEGKFSKWLIQYYKFAFVWLVVLIFVVPILIVSLVERPILQSIVVYINELINSIIVVISFTLVWRFLRRIQPTLSSAKASSSTIDIKLDVYDLNNTIPKTVDINEADQNALVTLLGFDNALAEKIVKHRENSPYTSVDDLLKISDIDPEILKEIRDDIVVLEHPAFEAMIEALEQKVISKDEFVEVDQFRSIDKWLQEGDLSGWYELEETVLYGEGLSPKVRSRIAQELWQVQQTKCPDIEKDDKDEERLRFLLFGQGQPVNDMYIAYDRHLVSITDVEIAEQTASMLKLVRDHDVTGLYELQEVVKGGEGLPVWLRFPIAHRLQWMQKHKNGNGITSVQLMELLETTRK